MIAQEIEYLDKHNEKAKPCPFCGGKSFSIAPYQNGAKSAILCNTCNAEGPLKTTEAQDVHQNAFEAWNSRL